MFVPVLTNDFRPPKASAAPRQAAPERSTPLTKTARIAPKEQQLLGADRSS